MESLSGVLISDRASVIRAMALELERAAIHIGDLGALAGDIAFQMGAAVFGVTRTLVINALMALTGSRFGRGLVRVGGVAMDVEAGQLAELATTLEKVLADVERMAGIMFREPTVLSRFEDRGVLSHQAAERIGMVGLAARASGLARDVRADHPFGAFKRHSVYKRTMEKGDIFCRAYLRYLEIVDSLKFVLEEAQYLPAGGAILLTGLRPAANSLVVSMMEGWRGEIVHVGLTDSQGRIGRYKIKDPSFNNWFGLTLAMRDNGISDFPVCNKSFNLSYSGFDL
jgi:Ni,Fe-hydrogenase III large subunit